MNLAINAVKILFFACKERKARDIFFLPTYNLRKLLISVPISKPYLQTVSQPSIPLITFLKN